MSRCVDGRNALVSGLTAPRTVLQLHEPPVPLDATSIIHETAWPLPQERGGGEGGVAAGGVGGGEGGVGGGEGGVGGGEGGGGGAIGDSARCNLLLVDQTCCYVTYGLEYFFNT